VIRPRAKSIRFRLTASYTAVLAFTFALIGVAVWIALEHSIQETADRDLHARLADIRRYVDTFSPEDLLHLEEEFREESLLSQSIANVRIAGASGQWLFRTPSTERWPAHIGDGENLPAQGRMETIQVGHQRVRVLTAPVKVGIVQVGLAIDEFEEVKSGFLWTIGLGSPVLLLLAAVGGYWVSGRALRPVGEISSLAERISAQDLSARLPVNDADDELDRLSRVLNAMFARLESAFHRMAEFTADASHELRTPVAVIQTTAELMQTRPRTVDEHVQAWSRVRIETERTSLLIADLLTLARSDAGKTGLEFRRMDFPKTVRAAAEEMRVMGEAKGLPLVVDGVDACTILGDAEALRRAVCILLDNAIKFTAPPAEVRVTVSVSGGSAAVSVKDEGVGIGADDLPMIFERFYRASKDRSRKTGGAGLGLSIARWIVEGHGGEIQVKSTLGKGSMFSILLPLESATPKEL
jgi:heavy metal sensor kinase